jgi:hypothetical protein
MGFSLQHHLRYTNEGEVMLNRIVNHCQPESKHASMQWKHLSLPSTKRLRFLHQLGSVCLMLWDSEGVPLAHFQNLGEM